MDSFNKATDPLHHLSLTSCWASPLPQHVEKSIYRIMCIQSQTCNFEKTGECQELHDRLLHFLYRYGILPFLSVKLSPLLPELFEDISPSVLAFDLGGGEDHRPFAL